MNGSSIQSILGLVRTAVIAAGVLLSVLALVEILRATVFLYGLSPWLGTAFVLALAGGIAWFVWRFVWTLARLPRAPAPPVVADPGHLTPEELETCSAYLQHRIAQLRENPRLSAADHDALEVAASALGVSPSAQAFGACRDELNRILAPLDRDAERIVQTCVRDVMAAVVLSPFRSADLLIVLYRNGKMVLGLATHYQSRPALAEELRIVRDVLAIVATVNLLNFTEKFFEQMLTGVPVLGGLAGDLSQGAGAGLLTSATGHAAIQRCRSIDLWDRRRAQEGIERRMPRFARDVKEIFSVDVLPLLRPRVPDFSSASEKIGAAFEAALGSMDAWVWRPVATAGTGVASATVRRGASAWRGARSGIAGAAGIVGRGSVRVWRKARDGVSGALRRNK